MWLFKKRDFATDEDIALDYYNTGNKDLVGQLFEKHVKTVFGICLFYFKDKDVAKDAVMQIFEKLITELKKTEVKNFKGWLSFVVRNYCISEIRKNKHKYRLPEKYLEFEVMEPLLDEEEKIASINDDLMFDHLQSCLPELKENQRVCVDLFYLKGQTYQQICDKTKFSLNEVKSYIQNGKRNLKLLIEEKIKNKRNAG
ncbi:MAG: sigma-70 family RNA polymerase sigma factor [Bacteroidia bacterium]|nr:sigma-70 family RNA polymerase sigma factor [Bacteroidia bacterium]